MSAQLVDLVRERLVRDDSPATPERVAATLRDLGQPMAPATVSQVWEALQREMAGAGVLEPLLREPGVTDVLVNGAEQVWVDRGKGLERREVRFADDAAVRRLAARLAAGGGRRLDDSSPYCDVRLPDGSRFHAVLAPVSRPGTVISLRVPARVSFSLADLCAAGAVSEWGAGVLRELIGARAAFLISGGTGSGKTTLLASLLSLVCETERMVLVEDSTELRPDHPHVVGLEARPANQEGIGQIDVQTLVRQALRMRPDRLVVGEVRGGEVVDLLAALNTGHSGGCGTLHANSAGDVPARIEALALAAGLPRAAVHAQFGSAIEVIIHVDRRAGVRQVREIAVPSLGEDRLVRMQSALTFDHELVATQGPGWDQLVALLEGAR